MWLIARSLLGAKLPAFITAAISVVLILLAVVQCGQKVGARQQTKRAQEAQQLAEAKLSVCVANATTLEASLKAQNDAVRRLEADGAAKVAAADKALQKALRGRKEAERIALELAQPQSGKTACERMEQTDALVLRSLR